jgi:hypothetical protein
MSPTAEPVSLPLGELEEPALLESSARWVSVSRGSALFEWQGSINNPNAVEVPVIVEMRLHDASGIVIHEERRVVNIPAAGSVVVTENGSMDEGVARRGSSWSFDVKLPDSDSGAAPHAEAGPDPETIEPKGQPVEPAPPATTHDATQQSARTPGEIAFRSRAGQPLGGIFEVVLAGGARKRVTSYRIEGDRVTLTLFSGATQVVAISYIDFEATNAAWDEVEQESSQRAPAPQAAADQYGTIDGRAQTSIDDPSVYLEWFREQVDQAFKNSYGQQNLLSDGAPSCTYVDANPTDVPGGDVCITAYRMSTSRAEWPEVKIRIGPNFEAMYQDIEARRDEIVRMARAQNIDASGLASTGELTLRGAQLALFSKLVRQTLADARADGIGVSFSRAAAPQFDDFGEPVPGEAEPYWSFEVSRGIAARINWDNFNNDAWPRIADDFAPGLFAADAASAPQPASTPSQPSGNPLDIIDVSTRVTERNNSWWRFAWILVLRNNTDAALSADATIEFVDADGFVIDDVNEYRLVVPANAQREFTGSTLINLPGAGNVSGVRGKAGLRDAPSSPSPARPPAPSGAPPGTPSSPATALQYVLGDRDPRNAGIEATVQEPGANLLDFSIQNIGAENSMADVFRVLLQFAEQLQDHKYSAVYLSFRGQRRFLVPGEYFQKIGREFSSQNPVFTMRTFPSQIQNLDGTAAYATWTGGLIGVMSKQMEDFEDLHREWYLNDLLGSSN